MKYILIIIFSIFMLIVPSYQSEKCNLQTVQSSLKPIIHFEQTIDGPSQNVLITRTLHNKVGILSAEFSKCYFNYFNPENIFSAVGLYGLFFFYLLYIKLIEKKSKIMLFGVLMFPILGIIGILPYMIVYYHKITAILGVIIFFSKK